MRATDGLRVGDVREHLRRLVDRGHGVAARDELTRHASGAAAQLEHGGGRRQRRLDELALTPVGQKCVEIDRAAVRRDPRVVGDLHVREPTATRIR